MKKLIEEAKALGIDTEQFKKTADLKAEIARVKALNDQNNTQETPENNQAPEETNTGENVTEETPENNQAPEETNTGENVTEETPEDNQAPEETNTGENVTEETPEDNQAPEETNTGGNKPNESAKAKTSTGNTKGGRKARSKTSKTPKTWTNEIGEVWAFTNKAPKTLNWKLKTYTQAEILSNDDIMEQLTTGAYSQIKRIK